MELIITEKPSSAKKVADALADTKALKKGAKGVPYYELKHNGKDIAVASAVGHLYGLAEVDKKKGLNYPVFNIKWIPTSDMDKGAAFSKKYLDQIIKLAKSADNVTVATDYDIEGEVIGLNIVRFACKRKDGRRMKFSALTKPDLVHAYEHASPHLDWGQAEAGETRHELDWFYGINLSRALMSAIKAGGIFKVLSTGRVQGPALKTIVDREKEIKAFKPVPFWQIELFCESKKKEFRAQHEKDKFWEKKEALAVFKKVDGQKNAKVKSVDTQSFNQMPPPPFDLTSLQTESYRCFGIVPKTTLEIAQDLYTAGYISYPRTSSQQLPDSLGFASIMKALAKQAKYDPLVDKLKKPYKPNNGKKTDPAHPAIYPTGIVPGKLDDRGAKIYDLIVKRFLSTFGEHAVRETVTLKLDCNGEIFIAKGTTTVKKGWHELYAPYVPFSETELPVLKEGDNVDIQKIEMQDKQTQPPKRFTEASIIKELEKRELGTKATRAHIVDTLYQRNYIKGRAIEATELGIHLVGVLEKHAPKIVDEELTRKFEQDMEMIRENKVKSKTVLDEAKRVLKELLDDFRSKEKDIGEGLKTHFAETRNALARVGDCLKCGKGQLMIKRGKFGQFIACDRYPDCDATFNLPNTGRAEVTTLQCQRCNYPVVRMIRKAKRPQEVCINPECPAKQLAEAFQEHPCPQCKEGTIILRRSLYGSFGACNKFPKCRHVERLAIKKDVKKD